MGETAVGRVGHVVMRVRGGEVPGEVELTVDGVPEAYLAYAPEALAVGAPVLVVSDRGGRSLDVVSWELAGP